MTCQEKKKMKEEPWFDFLKVPENEGQSMAKVLSHPFRQLAQ